MANATTALAFKGKKPIYGNRIRSGAVQLATAKQQDAVILVVWPVDQSRQKTERIHRIVHINSSLPFWFNSYAPLDYVTVVLSVLGSRSPYQFGCNLTADRTSNATASTSRTVEKKRRSIGLYLGQ